MVMTELCSQDLPEKAVLGIPLPDCINENERLKLGFSPLRQDLAM
jgi:hypothetical protein